MVLILKTGSAGEEASTVCKFGSFGESGIRTNTARSDNGNYQKNHKYEKTLKLALF